MISFLVWRTAKSKIVNNRDIFFYWFFILSINLCVVVIRVTQTTSLSNLGVGTISGFLMGLLIISAINKLRNKKSDERIQQRKEQPEAVKI
jgi:FtsH-binding integral membrane protein